MNIELKPRTISFVAPVSANDNADRTSLDLGSGFSPARRHVVIYKPAKSAMTSGRAGSKRWLLEFEPQSPPFIEPLMGWTGSTDPMAHIRLTFPTREAAVAYAERQGLDYEVRDAARPAKTRGSVDQWQDQPLPLWPIELLSDGNNLLMPEIGETSFAPNIAA